MSHPLELEATIPAEAAGTRLDRALAGVFPDHSRSRLQQWLKDGAVTVDGAHRRGRDKVAGGEHVHVCATVESDTPSVVAEPMALDVVHEDEHLLVVNKPAGLVVHPGAGNAAGTLQNALLHRHPHLERIPRCGIIHRIDKDTSGLLVVALSDRAHTELTRQLQDKTVGREYDALVAGTFTAGGTVDAPIGRHPVDRKRMSVRDRARAAVTHYRVLERFAAHTHIRLKLESGRTHQIRVHMRHIRHPLLGDPVYGGRLAIPRGAGGELAETLRGFRRQALHARRLGLTHPETDEPVAWVSDTPADLAALLAALRADAARRSG